jgi:chromosome segregation ATPase
MGAAMRQLEETLLTRHAAELDAVRREAAASAAAASEAAAAAASNANAAHAKRISVILHDAERSDAELRSSFDAELAALRQRANTLSAERNDTIALSATLQSQLDACKARAAAAEVRAEELEGDLRRARSDVQREVERREYMQATVLRHVSTENAGASAQQSAAASPRSPSARGGASSAATPRYAQPQSRAAPASARSTASSSNTNASSIITSIFRERAKSHASKW